MIKSPESFYGINCTINICELCSLKCSYCYETDKAQSPEEDRRYWEIIANSREPEYAKLGKEILEIADYSFASKCCDSGKSRVMSIDNIIQYIDLIVKDGDNPLIKADLANSGVIFDLIGGDALQYPELVSDTLDYLTYKLYTTDTELAKNMRRHWRCSISSNGLQFLRDDVRDLCEKWGNCLSVGVSIDGCPELHDLNRWIYPNDKRHKEDPKKYPAHIGSWRFIEATREWYKKQYPSESMNTKWTVAPNSYSYLFKSVKYLYEELGVPYIHFNRVMEDHIIDSPKDVKILVEEFKKVLEYVLENNNSIYVSALDVIPDLENKSYKLKACGFGYMPALSVDGDIFSCFRLLPHSNIDTRSFRQGSLKEGLVSNPSMLKYLQKHSCTMHMNLDKNVYEKDDDPERSMRLGLSCRTCPIISRCGSCAAGCFLNSIPNPGERPKFKRTSSICWFNKVQTLYSLKLYEILTRRGLGYAEYKDGDVYKYLSGAYNDLAIALEKQINEYINEG